MRRRWGKGAYFFADFGRVFKDFFGFFGESNVFDFLVFVDYCFEFGNKCVFEYESRNSGRGSDIFLGKGVNFVEKIGVLVLWCLCEIRRRRLRQ